VAELTSKQLSAVNRAKANPDLQWVLFTKAVGLKWFDAFEAAGFLAPKRLPRPVKDEKGYISIPAWSVLTWLANSANELADPANVSVATRVLEFIREATRFAARERFSNYRAWWQFSTVVRKVPWTLLTSADLAQVKVWLSDEFETGLIAENVAEWALDISEADGPDDVVCELLSEVFQVSVVLKKSGSPDFSMPIDGWHAKKIMPRFIEAIGSRLRKNGLKILESGISTVLRETKNDGWSSIWRPAIEEHEQNLRDDDVGHILISGLRDALSAFVRGDPPAGVREVRRLLSSRTQTMRRIAVWCVNADYELLQGVLGDVLREKNFSVNLQHELWHLLKDRFESFEPSVQKKTINLVRGLGRELDSEKSIAYLRATWAASLIGTPAGADLYRQQVLIAGVQPEHPDFSSYMQAGWVRHDSPVPLEDLKSIEPSKLTELLNAVEFGEPRRFGGSDIEGLARAVRELVKSSPLSYVENLAQFATSDMAYTHAVIEAFSELWREKAALPWDGIWERLIDFMTLVVTQDGFWDEENTKRFDGAFAANRFWIVGSIGASLDQGMRELKRSVPVQVLPAVRRLLVFLLSRESGESLSSERDAVSIAINSPRGKCLEALICFALLEFCAHKGSATHDETWFELQPLFDAELVRASRTKECEFPALLMLFSANFRFMSTSWTDQAIGWAFERGDEERWLAAMQGFTHIHQFDRRMYEFLRDKGHFAAALSHSALRSSPVERIVQFSAIAYLNDVEDLASDASGIRMLIDRGRDEELLPLISFLSHTGDTQKFSERILALWKALDTRLTDDSSIRGHLVDLAGCIGTLTEDNIALVERGMRLISRHSFVSYKSLERIAKWARTTPNLAARAWLALLSSQASADYPAEAVQDALTTIATSEAAGTAGQAKNIVGAYIKRGDLRPHEILQAIESNLVQTGDLPGTVGATVDDGTTSSTTSK